LPTQPLLCILVHHVVRVIGEAMPFAHLECHACSDWCVFGLRSSQPPKSGQRFCLPMFWLKQAGKTNSTRLNQACKILAIPKQEPKL
jgi:hypothetical protein